VANYMYKILATNKTTDILNMFCCKIDWELFRLKFNFQKGWNIISKLLHIL
jgi:hypothetical protein